MLLIVYGEGLTSGHLAMPGTWEILQGLPELYLPTYAELRGPKERTPNQHMPPYHQRDNADFPPAWLLDVNR